MSVGTARTGSYAKRLTSAVPAIRRLRPLPTDGAQPGWMASPEPVHSVDPAAWFLSAEERGNPDTRLDRRHPDGRAWTDGNTITPLVHGADYFRVLYRAVQELGEGDLLLFTDWRGDPDHLLDGPGTEVADVFAAAARRGADVRGLLWRSHFSGFHFSAEEHREFGEAIDEAGGECLLDMRVRSFGSHHQKLVVLRHRDRPQDDVAFVGGIDLCHGRGDDIEHRGDPQTLPMAKIYGSRPAWHDIQVAVRGPAVADAETVFRERWEDTHALAHHPVHVVTQLFHNEETDPNPLPAQLPDPPPCGDTAVQLLRTYPSRWPRYPYARRGERSIARGYAKVLSQARSLVYVEDQYLWSTEVVKTFAAALRRAPELRMIFVIPQFSEQDGRVSMPPNLAGRQGPLRALLEAGGERVAVYGLESAQGKPIYVHAKACIVDDKWACIGSDNTNRRSWSHDSELSVGFVDGGTVRGLRHTLSNEHLAGAADRYDLDDPAQWFDAFRDTAAALDAWHSGGKVGPRPPGQLRTYVQKDLSLFTSAWATLAYRLFYDPDGRDPRRRLMRRF